MGNLTTEQRVLLELLAGEISGETRLDQADLKSADWTELLSEAKAQAVLLMASEAAGKYRDCISNYPDWEKAAIAGHALNLRAAYNGQQLSRVMQGRPFIIIKGMVSASYYPNPIERSFGDIDFLIEPSQMSEIEALLSENGYKRANNTEHCHHVGFKKDDAYLEMHFEIPSIPYGKQGKAVRDFIAGAVKQPVTVNFDGWSFQAPADIYHGLIILLHMQGHMVSEGLGLRHICDWACYLQKTENMPFWDRLLDLFKEIGIFRYAQVISKISSMYFHINCPKWAESADEELCRDVMNDVLTGGNFGRKDVQRAKSGILISENGKCGTRRGKVSNLFWTLHHSTKTMYPIVKKHPILYPFLDIYRVFLYLVRTAKGERSSLVRLVPAANQRKSLYDRLHLFETENNNGK